MNSRFSSLAEFYPYYLSEHQNGTCRLLHFLGSTAVLAILAGCLYTQQPEWVWTALLAGYGPAWVGHFFFENNHPATFKHPFYSFLSDWLMYRDILRGKVPIQGSFEVGAQRF